MLVRYCATHFGYFGYPHLLGVRWNGWTISTAGGLCEACRERERDRWETAPYGQVLIPAPVELGPRMLVRRVVVATLAATTAAVLTTVALLVAQPPDLIPSGGEPGHFSSGARLVGSPSSTEANAETERPAASRPSRHARATPAMVASRAVHPGRPAAPITPRVTVARAPAPRRTLTPPLVAAQAP